MLHNRSGDKCDVNILLPTIIALNNSVHRLYVCWRESREFVWGKVCHNVMWILGLKILNRDSRSSATVMLNDLHWLSIKKRVMYKILLLVYKSLHGTTPDYITMRLNEYHPTRTLRSCEEKMHYGDITFSVSAAKLWNSIPLNLKCAQSVDILKKCLKTYLFKQD